MVVSTMALNINRFTGTVGKKLEAEVCGKTKYIFSCAQLIELRFFSTISFLAERDMGRIDKIMHYVKNFQFVYSYSINKSGVQRQSITKEISSIRIAIIKYY